MIKVTIDRFEGDLAVCEKADRTMLNIPRNEIPPEAREGDILIIEDNGIKLDIAGTKARKREISDRMKKLWRK